MIRGNEVRGSPILAPQEATPLMEGSLTAGLVCLGHVRASTEKPIRVLCYWFQVPQRPETNCRGAGNAMLNAQAER